ncbi:hypothetical protein [Sphingobacterium composti Ten et al. 2007 non Yoo et al. 2007]|uniref:hypothetical protein n=1 Tax=Sphingobacterium composti TaxID=363260 RepID=UPI00135BE57A|nr:hypothetical protein [Sphingobacterium composti Ten et al. 2007 non Yoo et al. 2007]
MGIASKNIQHIKIEGACSKCQSENSLVVKIHQKYLQYKSLSIVPIGKRFEISFGNCYNNLTVEQLDNNTLTSYQNSIKNVKTPLWTFSWIFVLIILVFCCIAFVLYNKSRKVDLIKNPLIGDVYEIKEGKRQYTLYKVVSVNEGKVDVIINEYTADNVKAIDDLFDRPYLNDTISLPITSLLNLIDVGRLFEIHRNK